MKILFATHNKAKLSLYRAMMQNTSYELVGLDDLNIKEEVEEDQTTTEGNSLKKAKFYSGMLDMPTIADDSGLFFDNVEDSLQPGTHVRRIGGKTLNDDELTDYYINLVKNHGGSLDGYFNKSVSISYKEKEFVLTYKVKKIFLDKSCGVKNPGFPLDSISITPEYNKYTALLTKEENELLIKKRNEEMFYQIISKLEEISEK